MQRMGPERQPKAMYWGMRDGKRKQGGQRKSWMQQARQDLEELRVANRWLVAADVGSKYRGGFSLLVPCGMIETTIQHLPSTTVRSRVTPVSLMWTKPDGNVCMYVCMSAILLATSVRVHRARQVVL